MRLAIIIVTLGATAAAVTPSPARIASECGSQLIELCASHATGPEDFVRCARAKDALLSEACQRDLAEARRPREERRERRRERIRAACEEDVERLCAGTARRKRPIAQCLDRRRSEVSARCLEVASRFLARHAD